MKSCRGCSAQIADCLDWCSSACWKRVYDAQQTGALLMEDRR